MTVFFADGFEQQFTPWSGIDNNSSGNIDVVASASHTGSYGALVSYSGAGHDYAVVYKSIVAANVLYTRIYFRVSALPASGQMARLLGFVNSAGAAIADIYLKNSGGTQIIGLESANGPSNDYNAYAVTLATNTWHYIELYCKVGTTGVTTVWLNGNQIINIANKDTSQYGSITEVYCAGDSTYTVPLQISIDDVAIADTYNGPLSSSQTLNVTATTGGTVTPSGQVPVTAGQTYVFNATPSQGYSFSNWTLAGVIVGTSLTLNLTVTVAMNGQTLLANFTAAIINGYLNVTAIAGTTPIGTSVTASGQTGTTPTTFTFPTGTYSITATYQGTTLPAQQVIITSEQTASVILQFPPPQYTLTVNSTPIQGIPITVSEVT